MSVKHVHDDDEFKKLIAEAGSKAVIVDFSAEWCGPCKLIAPLYEELAKANEGFLFLHVDVDECEGTSESFGVSAMPTFMVLVDGKKVEEFKGASEEKLKALIAKHCV